MEKIGLIAGNRRFPVMLAEAAKQKGVSLVAVCIKGETAAQIKNFVDKTYWLSLKDYKDMADIFEKESVKKVIMAGQVSPRRLFSREVSQSSQIQELLRKMTDRKANTIFVAVADLLKQRGIELIDSTTFLERSLPQKGTLTKRSPSEEEADNIDFGFGLAKHIAGLDIGLTVAVKNKAVVAVEALEGTDNLILRAGRLAGPGIIVVKVGRPNQDMRFDIPVIGPNTVKNLIRAKASCLAIEAKKTLFIDMEKALKLADSRGLSIIAV